MKGIKKYGLGFLALLLLAACAGPTFEWISINPEKIILARKAAPYHEGVKKVNLTFDMKEKTKTVYYNESDAYFKENQSNQSNSNPIAQREKRAFNKANTTTPAITKSTTKIVKHSSNTNAESRSENKGEEEAVSKLNDALKIPAKTKTAIKSIPNTNTKSTTKTNVPNVKQSPQTEVKKDQQAKNTISKESKEVSSRKGDTMIWAGLVLVVIGVVLGFIFGRSAFLIAVAGLVFAVIGFILKRF
ncbi:MAG: hypothetical protein IE931_10260 [Sphingobacteriales bacterium]|nr:hypothetical protein [Sphingobacteriales bacterium]